MCYVSCVLCVLRVVRLACFERFGVFGAFFYIYQGCQYLNSIHFLSLIFVSSEIICIKKRSQKCSVLTNSDVLTRVIGKKGEKSKEPGYSRETFASRSRSQKTKPQHTST